MIEDISSVPGYIILREEARDPAPCPSQDFGQPHPLDQLSVEEIRLAARLIRENCSFTDFKFNCITLREPKKTEYAAFRSGNGPRPCRKAFAIIIEKVTSKVAELIVDLTNGHVESHQLRPGAGPIMNVEDMDVCERIARQNPLVVEACREIGITDMDNIFIEAWAIDVDERWGKDRRIQRGLVFYRKSAMDNQFAHPLDFSVVIDLESEKVLAVDIRRVNNGERTKPELKEHNFLPEFIADGYQHARLKPVDITQPQGVSFHMRGNEIAWAGLKMHIGFNYREGIVLSDVSVHDPYENRQRSLFNRISVVEMVVPYGNPDPPHHQKHPFDVGEYGMGLMTNSLQLGCDCKGDPLSRCYHGCFLWRLGHNNGLLYKHTDYRDGSVISARDRKLIISHFITAGNYDYGFYHTFSLDGTYKLDVKLTGILNTYCLHPSETAAPYGTEVAPFINAHNHQHIFSLRVNPEIDGPNNSVVQNDAVLSDKPLGSAGNLYGNGFFCKKKTLQTSTEGGANYSHQTGRTWDIINPGSRRRGKPPAYKIINTSCPPLLAQQGSIVHKRAAFAHKSLWVVPYRDYEVFPAGDYVCRSTGETGHPFNQTIDDWVNRNETIENTDIVCYIQFGLTHFPRAEDFPVMPVEPVSVMMRASNFFEKNPALWVPPSAICVDTVSRHDYKAEKEPLQSCCLGSSTSSKL
ncbi:uncharacterized protein NECHADRAFT_94904 [Fusarium vanettenii 77-13-4]|uniref:Amine oxidase n=1 Tax=Fusarium vanettenii (strain ATCC MYA-4622 / CBS 123669 / FGSC 9596 / NRRL 45880 / 77-13-4) TaxID=660122 RepID=C7YXC5_FUSV7|nr:uncharacterized protein NECHADRAFT_94904 [Fusarium vanettenii 77-13-4]EEU43565.1 hypothetical protein NECHADRAFT_94904 [Fusarium vanettenii 77-13-4]